MANGAGPSFALSPDGRRLVVVGRVGEESGLWVRDLSQDGAFLLPGTEGAWQPAFDPSGDWIAYFADGGLWKVASSGGSPQRVADTDPATRGVAWIGSDRLVFAPSTTAPLRVVDAAGGEARDLTDLAARSSEVEDRSHRWPSITPDGRFVVYTAQLPGQDFEATAIDALELATGRTTRLRDAAGVRAAGAAGR